MNKETLEATIHTIKKHGITFLVFAHCYDSLKEGPIARLRAFKNIKGAKKWANKKGVTIVSLPCKKYGIKYLENYWV